MRPEEINDGLEFKTCKHLVVVGAQVHKYIKDPAKNIVEPTFQLPRVETPAMPHAAPTGRSGRQLLCYPLLHLCSFRIGRFIW